MTKNRKSKLQASNTPLLLKKHALSIFKKRNEILFSLIIFLLPTQLTKHFWPPQAFVSGVRLDYLSPALYFTDLPIAVLLFLNSKRIIDFFSRLKSKKNKKLLIFISALVLFAVLNIQFSLRPLISAYYWLRILFLILFFIVIKSDEKLSFQLFFKLLPFPLFYSSIFAIFQFIKQQSIGGWLYWLGERYFSLSTPGISKIMLDGQLYLRPYSTFSHPNSLAGFLLVGISLLLFTKEKSNFHKIIMPLVFTALFLTLSQLSMALALLLLMFYFLTLIEVPWANKLQNLKYQDHQRKNLRADLPAGELGIRSPDLQRFGEKGSRHTQPINHLSFSGLLLSRNIVIRFFLTPIIVLFLIILLLKFPIESESIKVRIYLAEQSIKVFIYNPILGVGLGNNIPAVNILPNAYLNRNSAATFFQPVHNIFLIILSELGLFGFFYFLGLIIFSLEKSFINKKHALFIALLIILSTGMFDHYWLTLYQNRILFFFILSFIFI